ncbi:hypothetical protein KDW_39260 [Dictyobacter vulcani]|uniref:Uncharacterized protein n=1 Tax=Dictyobacter vulcani TaxID=2607529 RepID=A0A5J4KJU3_9CHLR|nr:hypothetical protein [Dictyobacter vulcani]GER89764.1 hypothetical protein KDW_39260 [Dictyobacter vulcani]
MMQSNQNTLNNFRAEISVRLLNTLNSTEIERIALINLGLAKETGMSIPQDTIQAETIRAALWMHSAEGTQSVHIQKLLNSAKKLIEPIYENRNSLYTNTSLASKDQQVPDRRSEESQIQSLYGLHRESLTELEQIGDIVELPNGYWRPAPLRKIYLADVNKWILVGGLPTARFPNDARQVLEHNNFARFCPLDPEMLGILCPNQSLDDWLKKPKEQIEKWARNQLEQITLQNYSHGEYSLEVYWPYHNNKYQYLRWTKNYDLPDDRYLARFEAAFSLHYRVIEIKNQKIIKIGELEIGLKDYRRLFYGIDAYYKRPVNASIQVKLSQQRYLVNLENELPKDVQRLFTALGYVQPNQDGKYYPRIWHMPLEYEKQVDSTLQNLGVHIHKKKI